ncbi:LytR/AlgR family response regulator transcription factor [Aureibacter tunicatorum]|uniref:DNA-binding LytR/AlgR family response regulator n=1 Tax=Aureibacter tunicatorum TaxID=866807 RepID=A0AAE4BQT2_9BACT|nr:LytTR family DNA-binding domain-containing protein [Aureibacter tunicatorum]MDR6237911.1 DNA-binding LytR/AlgR family response regulator [Aureibacter tunicatorum]BDD02944.1 DNA-binding response regulator [Aureibacter tunicatorum]
MLKCIAIDDEAIALNVIKAFCDKIPFIELTRCFTQTSLAYKYLAKFPTDLIFLDIQMPDTNGIDFYKRIQQETMVIFTTAYSQYAVEGFNVNAVDYLLKPIEFNRFKQSCQKALDYYEFKKESSRVPAFLYVRSEYALVKIPFNEITYCETLGDYVKIHRKESSPVLSLMSLTKLMNQLPDNQFLRVHRSFIVSISKIDQIRANNIMMNEIKIPIGSSYKADIIKRYKLE